jgi:hypothetical protein
VFSLLPQRKQKELTIKRKQIMYYTNTIHRRPERNMHQLEGPSTIIASSASTAVSFDLGFGGAAGAEDAPSSSRSISEPVDDTAGFGLTGKATVGPMPCVDPVLMIPTAAPNLRAPDEAMISLSL